MTKIILSGKLGKMEQAIARLAKNDSDLEIVDDIKDADIFVDFSGADPSINNLRNALNAKIPVVMGSTGHSENQLEEIKSASAKVPIIFAPNMSVGVNVMFDLIKRASVSFGNEYKVAIEETHHAQKKDKPSGTAKKMVEMVGRPVPDVTSFREGKVVGEHEITFSSPYEVLKISHSALSRDVLAAGALKAVKWIVGKKPGLYDMKDVLGL